MKPTTIYHRLLLLAAVPALVLAACTKDDALTDDGNNNGRTPVRLTAAIQSNAATTQPATRLVPGGTDGAQALWAEDDKIGVFMLPADGKLPADTLPAAHNVPYSIDPATGVMTQAVPEVYNPATGGFDPGVIVPMHYPMTHDKVDFVAYYPYRPLLEVDHLNGFTPYIYGIGLWDQTTAEKQYASDVLYSDNACGIRRSKDAIDLRFRHLNAKLRLDITLGEGLEGGKVTKVTLPNVPWAVQFDMRDGSVSKVLTPAPDEAPMSCLKLASPATGTNATATFTALVPPHKGEKFAGRQITVTVDGTDYTGTIPDTHNYDGNTMYIYPVNVTPSIVTVGAPKDDVPWTDADVVAQVPGYDLTVANEKQLRAFAAAVNSRGQINGKPAAEARVLQTADIELKEGEWVPIGNNIDNPFRGAYNGDGHTITGLTITTPPEFKEGIISVTAGLFSSVIDAVLTGIHLREVEIDIQAGSSVSGLFVGSITGDLRHSTLSLCSATGRVNTGINTRSLVAGGMVGFSGKGSTISRCWAGVETTATMTYDARRGQFTYVGGIVGNNENSFILSCETQGGAVTAEGGNSVYAGGIVGQSTSYSLIAFCRTGENTVTARNATRANYAGGLVGSNMSTLYSCYSRATAEAPAGAGNKRAGAIVGYYNRTYVTVKYCYATGATDQGSSNLDAVDGNIVYKQSPSGNGDIFNVMRSYKDMVESTPSTSSHISYYHPYTTRYNPATYPAHGIEKVKVKWGRDAWQHGIDTRYPEINMEYGGVPNTDAP